MSHGKTDLQQCSQFQLVKTVENNKTDKRDSFSSLSTEHNILQTERNCLFPNGNLQKANF